MTARGFDVSVGLSVWAGSWANSNRQIPRPEDVTAADLQAQYGLAMQVRDSLGTIYDNIRRLRGVRDQANTLAALLKEDQAPLADTARAVATPLTRLSPRSRTSSSTPTARADRTPSNFQPRLDHQFAYLYGFVAEPEGRPTEGSYEPHGELNARWVVLHRRLDDVIETLVAEFNAMLARQNIPPIISD